MFDPSVREQLIWGMIRTYVGWVVLWGLAIWQGPKILDAVKEWANECMEGKHRTGQIVVIVCLAAALLYGVITKLAAQPPPAW
jgi:hypothetical protein